MTPENRFYAVCSSLILVCVRENGGQHIAELCYDARCSSLTPWLKVCKQKHKGSILLDLSYNSHFGLFFDALRQKEYLVV